MAYQDNFKLADDMIAHLNTVVLGVTDPFISSRYVGFVAVSAVTVYELAIKEIFCTFANKKHKVLGTFTESYFNRINGRIKLQIITDEYVGRFGKKYVDKFVAKIEEAEKRSLKIARLSVKSCYNNIIVWRNDFAHEGKFSSLVTYEEVIDSYATGKQVIDCLDQAMRR